MSFPSPTSKPIRTEEQADDYRYFPDPDLPRLRVEPALLERIRGSLPELPHVRRARYVESFGLPPYDAAVLTEDLDVSEFVEAAVRLFGQPKTRLELDHARRAGDHDRVGQGLERPAAHARALGRALGAGRRRGITAGSARARGRTRQVAT